MPAELRRARPARSQHLRPAPAASRKRPLAARYFMPQSGAGISRSAGTRSRPLGSPAGDLLGGLDGRLAEIENAQDYGLARDRLQHAEVELRLCRLDRDLVDGAVGERLQEGIAPLALVVHQLARSRSTNEPRLAPATPASARSKRLDRVASGKLRARGFDPGLIELNDVGAGLLEIAGLLVEALRQDPSRTPPRHRRTRWRPGATW